MAQPVSILLTATTMKPKAIHLLLLTNTVQAQQSVLTSDAQIILLPRETLIVALITQEDV